MSSIVRNLIEYGGLSDYLPDKPVVFKEFSVQQNLSIPSINPSIQQIVKVILEVNISSNRVIKTSIATSLEGQRLTGWKLIVEGELNQKIEYVANKSGQRVHVVHFKIPFSTFIILPNNFSIGTCIKVTPYIEDIYVDLMEDKQNIFNSATILLDVALQ